MPSIVFRFPAGRYHATPWGHHVNEGLVEWPPSPWRIARALIATGYSKLGWSSPPETARALIDALASVTPTYRLPAAVGAHTRHFMPTDSPDPDKRTKVFDAFAHVGRGELAVTWDVELSPECARLFCELVPKLSYLGRAESVVQARVEWDSAALPEGTLASTDGAERVDAEPIVLLAPQTQAEYAEWLASARPPSKSTKSKPKSDPFPPDALAALTVDTTFLQQHGWTRPPGSTRVAYYRPPLSTVPERAPVVASRALAADSALIALASDTRSSEVLPRLERALPCAELLHAAAARHIPQGVSCPELLGCGPDGSRLEGHRHATWVPLDLDGDGRLDHVLVHAPMGLGRAAQQALRALRVLHTRDMRLFATIAGMGSLASVTRGLAGLAVVRESSRWVTATPFVPPRHLKARRHTLHDQVQAELASRGLPAATRIDVMDREDVIRRGFHRFVRARRDRDRAPPAPRFFGLRIELERPAAGPLALGYASHFGLGLLVPDSATTSTRST